MRPRDDDRWRRSLAAMFRSAMQAAVNEAVSKVRTSSVLPGAVEQVDTDLDVVYVRMDQQAMSGDPTQSSNYGNPGVISATRLGSTFDGEQVRVSFDPTSGASAMQTSAETRIRLPFG